MTRRTRTAGLSPLQAMAQVTADMGITATPANPATPARPVAGASTPDRLAGFTAAQTAPAGGTRRPRQATRPARATMAQNWAAMQW